jgi:hypothetical protein
MRDDARLVAALARINTASVPDGRRAGTSAASERNSLSAREEYRERGRPIDEMYGIELAEHFVVLDEHCSRGDLPDCWARAYEERLAARKTAERAARLRAAKPANERQLPLPFTLRPTGS